MNTVRPTWTTKLDTIVKELVTSLTKFGHQQTNSILKLETIDKHHIELNTKVDAMLTPLTKTYAYQNIIDRFKNLEQVDKYTATHCSDRYTQYDSI